MKEKKFWLPYPLWDMPGIEGWIQGMASRGFSLEKCPGFWSIGRFRFQPSEKAGHIRYRLDPIGKDLRERAANYREMGWYFVDQIGGLYAVYRCDDPEAPDLYTDPESLGLAMKRLICRQWIALALCLLWAGWLMREELVLLFTDPAILLMQLILNSNLLIPGYLFLLAAIGVEIAHTLRQTVRFTLMRRQLSKGELPPVQRRTYPHLRMDLWGLVIFLCGVLFFFFAWKNSQNTQRLPDQSEWAFPHVTLAEILPSGTELRERSAPELLHYDTFASSWLAPEQYSTEQGALARLPDGTSREIWLALDYFRVRSPELAQWVYQGQAAAWQQSMENYQKNWSELVPILYSNPEAFDFFRKDVLSYPGLDQLTRFTYQYSNEDYPRACYVGRLEEQVFLLSFRGPDPEQALTQLTQRLTVSTL